MDNNELRLAKLIRAYIGAEGTSITTISREIGIPRETLTNFMESKARSTGPSTYAKLIYWLLQPGNTEPPEAETETTQIPVTETNTPRKPVGKNTRLSPRMRRLVEGIDG